MSKVVVRIFGGLGNQLFIYATAKALSLRNKTSLELEVRTGFVRDNYKRSYKLNYFNINDKKCSYFSSILFISRKRFISLSNLFLKNVLFLNEINPSKFQNELLTINLDKNTFLQGYWQSPLYFKDFENEIKSDLKINLIISNHNISILNEIRKVESVSIHVRRIDYPNPLKLEYYINAINLISKKLENPAFYIFSDDIDWCKENFDYLKVKYFVENNSQNEIEDFYLMTICNHFIIANSSFSWWGAWLSDHKNKIVIAPLNPGIGCEGFYPKNWITI